MLLRNVLFLVTVVCAIRTRSRLGEQIDCTNYDNGDKETLLLTFTCISKSNFNSVRINCEKIPAYVTSWPCEAALRIKEDEKLNDWADTITDIDQSFSADIQIHCTPKCRYVKLTHIAGGFGKGSDTKEEIFKQLGKAVAKGEAIPGVFLPYDMTHSGSPYEQFPVAKDGYTVFGKSNYKKANKGHPAATGACSLFRNLINKAFVELQLSLLAYFIPDGTFVLYDHLLPKHKRPMFSNAILNDFFKVFAHHDVLKSSIRRKLWDTILQETPPLTEDLLDKMIAIVHRTLESVKLVADSKQVQAMSKGVVARKEEVWARKMGTVAVIAGSSTCIIVGVLAAPFIITAMTGGVATAATVVAVSGAGFVNVGAKVTMSIWKKGLADTKTISADQFGQTQNQLRWVKDMLKWSETWLESDPDDMLLEAHPNFRVRPEVLCSHLINFNYGVTSCDPFRQYRKDPASVESSSVEMPLQSSSVSDTIDLAWDDPKLKHLREKYKAQFLTTFIQFVTHDGGCSTLPFKPFDIVKPFAEKPDDQDETITQMYNRMFNLKPKNNYGSESLEEIKEAKLLKSQLLLASCEEMLTTIEYNAYFFWDSKNKKKKHKKEYISRCSMIVVESQEQHDSNKEFCEKVIEVTKDSFGNKKKKLRNRRIDLCVQFIEKKVQEEEKKKKLEEEKKKRIDTGRGN